MIHQFDEHRGGILGERLGGSSLPSGPDVSHEIDDAYAAIRFSTVHVDGAELVSRLSVEAKHPKIPGDSRVFDLSHVLAEGYRRHPATVSQIVNPNLSLESRLDALRTVAFDIAQIKEPVPPLHDTVYGSKEDRFVDGLERTLVIKQVVLTEFADILQGYSRRGVTVVRNEEPWVQFHITERSESLCNASIVIMPTGLEFPLLDRSGHPVTDRSLNGAIHDFIHILRQERCEPELKALEAVAAELTKRLRRHPDPPPALAQRDFGHEVAVAARNSARRAPGSEEQRGLTEARLLNGEFHATELPDRRVFWSRHRLRPISSEVTFIVDSLDGSRFEVSFHYPSRFHQRVARLLATACKLGQWPQFRKMTDFLRASPGGGFAVVLLQSADLYPAAVNALMHDIEQALPQSGIDRGLLRARSSGLCYFLPEFLSELVKGRSPFSLVVDNGSPAESWHVQVFLDRDLQGTVYAVNALGGSLVVGERQIVGSLASRRSRLLKFFKLLAEDSGSVTHNPNRSRGFYEVRRNLPENSGNDALGYAAAIHGASIVWDALVKEGGFTPEQSASGVRWDSRKLREGVWAVSLVAPTGRGAWLPYLITVTANPSGIIEISYSRGARGLLGGLQGRRVRSLAGGAFSDGEVWNVVRVIAGGSKGTLAMSEGDAFSSVSPFIVPSFLSSLRSLDPERERRDLLSRFWKYLKSFW